MCEYYYAKEREESTVERINDSYLEALSSLEKLETENVKLRKLVRDWWALAVGGADSLPDWNAQQADLEYRMNKLGVEVD